MLTQILRSIFKRDLELLSTEIAMYQNEEKLWHIEGNIANSSGNLCLHLVGNLNHFIGAVLDNTGYVRQRDLEFSSKDIPKSVLLEMIKSTADMIEHTFSTLSDEQLEAEYPIVVFAEKMTTAYFLVHLATHLTYHLGQINYHRRLLEL